MIDASLIGGAVDVRRALWETVGVSVTVHEWISSRSARAVTLTIMILNRALRVRYARIDDARIDAPFVQAGHVWRALIVGFTDSLDLFVHWDTSDGCIPSEVWQALADHGSHWQRVHDGTSRSSDTRFRFYARIFANAIETAQFAWTVAVYLTLRLWLVRFYHARGVRISRVTRWTPTDRAMIDRQTLSGKWTIVWTRIYTLRVAAHQRSWTVVVSGALCSLAGLIRIP